jgi:hypothetical protein
VRRRAPELTGVSNVTGLTVLGQELPVNQVVERTISLVDSQSIDPSDANLDNLQLAPGVVLTNPVRTQLQQVLDALPDIQIPAALATIKITPGQQIREGDKLTQRALQVQVTVLGQQLADLVIGEASVGSAGARVRPGRGAGGARVHDAAARARRRHPRAAAACGCSATPTALHRPARRHLLHGDGRRVARPVVRRDGSFRATAPLPAGRLRATNRARYRAGSARASLRLKLLRRMRVFSVRTQSAG